MRIAVTGGGTGGHAYPALEVARTGRDAGDEVRYFGSLRGQESRLCEKAGLAFVGFPSLPLASLLRPQGWAAVLAFLRSRLRAGTALGQYRAEALFTTGGYGAAPVVSAALARGIPVVIHEQNAVPGRSNLAFARRAAAVGVTFTSSERFFQGLPVVRTGYPIRRELRALAERRAQELLPHVLVVGGSQGAQSVNEAALGAAQRMVKRALHWTHVTGRAHFEGIFESCERLGLKGEYEVKAYLEAEAMGEAYSRATAVVGRAGAGTLAELAAFRLPSVLVPYPFAYADHQRWNALEFAEMKAATIVENSLLSPASLEAALVQWLDSPESVEEARLSLEKWDVPDASQKLYAMVRAAAGDSQ